MAFNEEDYLQLSGIQHFKFCRRQWALIHIENQWAENVRTVDGEAMHRRAHDAGLKEKRGELVIVRDLRIHSAVLGCSGACDVVEFHRSEGGAPISGWEGNYQPFPVEYKRGLHARTTPTRCSSADRRCVWRRCCAARSRKARSITARRDGVSSSILRPHCGKR